MKTVIFIIIFFIILGMIITVTIIPKLLSLLYFWGNPLIEDSMIESYFDECLDLTKTITGTLE